MSPIFGGPDVYRNRFYGGRSAAAPQPDPVDIGDGGAGAAGGIFGQRQRTAQDGATGGVFTGGGTNARQSGTGPASNMTGGDSGGSNMIGGPPTFGANVSGGNVFTGPAYDPSKPPGTPPPAPTSAQVTANPGDYAGTSFDPNLSAQFRPPTGLANSTTADTRDSNGEVIRGYQPSAPNPARGADPSSIPGWITPGTTPNGLDPTRTQLGTQQGNQTLIYGPYQGTWGYRMVNTADIDSGQAFVDATAPGLRSGLQVTPEWIAQQRRFFGVR